MSLEYQEDKKPLNSVQYAAKDYPTFFDSILARLRENYGDDYDDFASTSVGVMLVNLMAYSMSQLSWYLDRRSSESYLATARTLDSVTRLASQIGYKPKRASAASADLNITFEPLVADAIMSKGFKFEGPSGLGYALMTDVVLAAGTSSVTVTVSEGAQRTQTFTSTGAASQLFLLPGVLEGEYVADQSVRVFVNGLEWEEKDFIVYERSNHFSVSYTTDPPRVIFGDGSAGNIPDKGADIRIDYRVIKAEAGNVRSGTITKAIDQLIVAGDFVSIDTVTNPNPASGGSGPQSISEIKKVAPLAFQAGGSAVTQQDYYALVNSFSDPVYGSVSKGYAAVTRSTSLDVTTAAGLDALTASLNSAASDARILRTAAESYQRVMSNLHNDIGVNTGDINAKVTTVINSQGNIKSLARQVSDHALSASGYCQTIQDLTSELTGLVNAAAPLDLVQINSLINSINELAISAKVSVGNASALARDSIQSDAESNAETLVEVIVLNQGVISRDTTVRNTEIQWLADTQATADQAIVIRNGGVVTIDDLRLHLDGLFDDSCKANVVTVPILVEGREGFYEAPSRGLIRALQVYLDEVKEVTHLVRVVSGATALVPANIQMFIAYDASYVKAEVRAEITAGIDALLRRRDFSKALFVSDLYSVVELIDGISHVNITITGPATHLDADGNLVVNELEVVTKGSVTITEVE